VDDGVKLLAVSPQQSAFSSSQDIQRVKNPRKALEIQTFAIDLFGAYSL